MKTKIRAPKGFIFEIVPYSFYNKGFKVKLRKKVSGGKGPTIGYVSLIHYRKNVYETHSFLNSSYRGKGFGAKLYAKAIEWCLENGYKIRSSGSSSPDAQRVWTGKSIRKHFTVRKIFRYKEDKRFGNDYATWIAFKKNNMLDIRCRSKYIVLTKPRA